jgi:hypothetical protein
MEYIKHFEAFTKDILDELKKSKKTYLKRRININMEKTEKYRELLIDLVNYDISNFRYNNKPYDFYIIPDNIFIDIIIDLNKCLEFEIPTKIQFDFSYDPNNLNLVDFKKGIPDLLRNIGLGYKLYLFVIDKVKFLTTNKFSSEDAINVWHGLVLNENLYSFTSSDITGIILKNQSNEEIIKILDKIKNYNLNILKFNFEELIFDEELIEKINEIYGSLDIYKQK